MANYGWTWNELIWGVPYAIVQRMSFDAPGYEDPEETEPDIKRPDKPGTGKKVIPMTNLEEIANIMNKSMER